MNAVFSIAARDRIGRAKYVPTEEYQTVFADIDREMAGELEAAVGGAAK